MILAVIMLAFGSLLASGILFRHQRVLTYLAAAGVLLEGQWLLLTLIDRTVAQLVVSSAVFTVGSFVLLLLWLFLVKKWRRAIFVLRRDLAVLIVLSIVLLAAWVVVSVNGFIDGAWVAHSFYNGDTMTFISLVQRSQLTSGLVDTNPFAGGGALEYPTLLHAAWASAVDEFGLGMQWLHLLPMMTLIQVLLTVPIFFLLWDTLFPEPKERWRLWFGIRSRAVIYILQAVLVLYILALSWDGYIYPQSHFFLTGLFVLLAALLARGWIIPAVLTALVLMMSNAVTGTAAVAIISVFHLMRAADRSRSVGQRVGYLLGVPVWVVLFMLFTPGQATFGLPGFPYTAAGALLRLAPVLIALMAAVWLSFDRQRFMGGAIAVLIVMAFFTFFFSTRGIVAENAGRFIYHALLVGFPLLLGPLIRLFYWLRVRLMLTSLSLAQQVIGWVTVGAVILLTLLPAGASVASAHDHLMLKDEKVISQAMLEALVWLSANAGAKAVVLASPEEPWAVPQFTGRSLLRINHWLSPPDYIFDYTVAAFNGETAAQEIVLQRVQFLLLTSDEQLRWPVEVLERVFNNGEVSIYRP